MYKRFCAAVVTLGIAAGVALFIRELPGGIRELRCIRMAKWTKE